VRQNASALFAANITFIDRVCSWMDGLDTARIVDALEGQKARPMLQELEQWLPRWT
jgi:hypothetical protein